MNLSITVTNFNTLCKKLTDAAGPKSVRTQLCSKNHQSTGIIHVID